MPAHDYTIPWSQAALTQAQGDTAPGTVVTGTLHRHGFAIDLHPVVRTITGHFSFQSRTEDQLHTLAAHPGGCRGHRHS